MPMGNRKPKALFVTHNYGMYGASQSLQLFLKEQKAFDVTLVIPKKQVLTQPEREKISRRFGVEENKIKQFFLPWTHCFEGRKTDLLNRTLVLLKNLLWKMNRTVFYRFIARGRFDFIHLNSLVLCEAIRDAYPFFIHIREVLADQNPSVFHHIRKSKGVIFIDESVEKPFLHMDHGNSLVLGNPVDMSGCANYANKDHRFDGQVVIAMIGRMEEAKGVGFVIQAFTQNTNDRLRLLIVGDKGDGFGAGYVRYCREAAAGDDRICFWGQEKDIFKIYALSDYIIRGEVDFRMGRSILEALYSDCEVIIPCSDKKIMKINEELIKYSGKINTYLPREQKDLTRLFSDLPGRKIKKTTFDSNVNRYVTDLTRYFRNTL
jgi:glycosyltransferase involved in cell wall biosynthesis